jgi:coatomer subunit beta'
MYLLGYVSNENRLYLGDKEMSIVSFELSLSVLEYQTAVMRKDFERADQVLSTIPKEQRTRVAHFLEKQGYRQQALSVTLDNEHKFDLAFQLENLQICYDLAIELENEQKWLQLSDIAAKQGNFTLVQECLTRAQAFGSLLLLASASSDKELMSTIGNQSRKNGQFNIAFLSNFVLGKLDQCLDILIENQRLPEAAFFARTYLPSQINRIIGLWREKLKQMNMERAAQALANPTDYENLFPGLIDTYKTEQFLKQQTIKQPARNYQTILPNSEKNPIAQMKEAENNGQFSYIPIQLNKDITDEDDDDETFDDANEIPIQSTIKSMTDSSIVNKLIPPVNSDRSRSQSPMDNFTIRSNKPTSVSSIRREVSGTSKASSIISTTATTGSDRRSLSDLDKELQEFDIDLDKNNVSDTENGPLESKGTFKKSTDENEVKC